MIFMCVSTTWEEYSSLVDCPTTECFFNDIERNGIILTTQLHLQASVGFGARVI